MSNNVRIPPPLRNLTAERDVVPAEGANIGEILSDLEKNHPGLKERICDETGKVRRFVNIFLNDEDIRFLDGLETEVPDGAEVTILPAVGGG